MPNKVPTKTSFKPGKNHTLWKGGCSEYYRMEARRRTNYPKNKVVHHIDGNPKNNILNNLQIMTQSEHLKLHHKSRIYHTKQKSTLRKNIKPVVGLKKEGLTYQQISDKLKINKRMVKHCVSAHNKLKRGVE